MNYINGWDRIKERFNALWHNEIIDRCCISVTSLKDNSVYKKSMLPESTEDKLKFWTDGERVLERYKDRFLNTYYAGDAFPVLQHDLGASYHAGFFKNARYRYEDSLWFFPSINDWRKDTLEFDENSYLYKKTIELAGYYAREANGDFIISTLNNCGNLDALSHLRGSQNLLIDMKEDPECIKDALKILQHEWEKINEKVHRIIFNNNDGGNSIGWMRTWANGKHTQIQCDLSVMLSPAMFDEFVYDEIEQQAEWADYSVYHMDGVEQIRHLDSILSVKKLNMIQWNNIAGKSCYADYMPVLRKIQKAGKGLLLRARPEETEFLIKSLSSKGLFIYTWVNNQNEADDIVKLAEKNTHE